MTPPSFTVSEAAELATVEQGVRVALSRVIDPEIRRPITDLDMVGAVAVDESGHASVTIKLTITGCPAARAIENDVRQATLTSPGVTGASIDMIVMTTSERAALTEKLRGGRSPSMQFGPDTLTRIIAISSGKGGVGKSTLTANLAVELAQRGLRVGIVDADVFGFSIPALLGVAGVKPTQIDGMILPPVAHGVKVISIGMFVDGNQAVSWRGPMLHRTIQQFLTDVYFGDLDILLIDLPPGTGDVAISLGQLLPHAEVIVVTTPQVAAADVAERSAAVARQTGQRVIGVIENMAGMVQTDGSVLELFGAGGGELVAARLSVGQPSPVEVLASVPLSLALRVGGDAGLPVVLGGPSDAASVAITQIADRLVAGRPSLRGKKLGLTPR